MISTLRKFTFRTLSSFSLISLLFLISSSKLWIFLLVSIRNAGFSVVFLRWALSFASWISLCEKMSTISLILLLISKLSYISFQKLCWEKFTSVIVINSSITFKVKSFWLFIFSDCLYWSILAFNWDNCVSSCSFWFWRLNVLKWSFLLKTYAFISSEFIKTFESLLCLFE